MNKLRMRFSKTGRAVYISHLDLMHTMQRAFARAGYRIKHSEGYNPHPIISIALPLSVGAESMCEVMDFRLEGKDEDASNMVSRLNSSLPEGIEVLEIYESDRKAAEIRYLAITGVYEYDRGGAAEKAAALNEFYAQSSIEIMKKSKRGMTLTDIAPMIKSIAAEPAGDCAVSIRAVICAQEPTLNPELLVSSLKEKRPELAPDFAKFKRVETYDAEMKVFR